MYWQFYAVLGVLFLMLFYMPWGVLYSVAPIMNIVEWASGFFGSIDKLSNTLNFELVGWGEVTNPNNN
jgi:hypothetical protein